MTEHSTLFHFLEALRMKKSNHFQESEVSKITNKYQKLGSDCLTSDCLVEYSSQPVTVRNSKKFVFADWRQFTQIVDVEIENVTYPIPFIRHLSNCYKPKINSDIEEKLESSNYLNHPVYIYALLRLIYLSEIPKKLDVIFLPETRTLRFISKRIQPGSSYIQYNCSSKCTDDIEDISKTKTKKEFHYYSGWVQLCPRREKIVFSRFLFILVNFSCKKSFSEYFQKFSITLSGEGMQTYSIQDGDLFCHHLPSSDLFCLDLKKKLDKNSFKKLFSQRRSPLFKDGRVCRRLYTLQVEIYTSEWVYLISF